MKRRVVRVEHGVDSGNCRSLQYSGVDIYRGGRSTVHNVVNKLSIILSTIY